MVKKVGILVHPKIEAAGRLAGEMEGAIRGAGAACWRCSAWEEEKARGLMPGTELLFTLGGDGTILRAARIAIPWGTPIVGVNLGRLGFITSLAPGDVLPRLPSLLAGEGWIEERAMVQGELLSGDGHRYHGLNDVVVARGSAARVIHTQVWIDGEPLPPFKGDGVIVATATGSTGYALSAGGPILHPQARELLLQPISAHLSWSAALVLPPEAVVELEVTADHPALMSVDGQVDTPLKSGDRVRVRRSPHLARFLRTEPPGFFYRTLGQRLIANLGPGGKGGA